jgi:hypothetical protein
VDRLSIRRAGLAVLGWFAAVSILVAVAAEVGHSEFARLYNLGLFEWAVPVVAGVAAGALAWLVLDGVHDEDDQPSHSAAACPACGRSMLDDWRLCPHCGTLVAREPLQTDGISQNR